MLDIQEKLSEQLSQLTQYQKEAVEKLQAKSAAGVETFEKFARHNLAVMGDVVDFTVEQGKLATTATEPQELVSKQIENAAAFAKIVEGRTKEYIGLLSSVATNASDEIRKASEETVVKAVKKTA